MIDSFAPAAIYPEGHSQGIFVDWVYGLLLEECLLDHNGWNLNVSPPAYATIFRHNVYIHGNVTGVTVRGNIVARGGAHGIMSRPGGDILFNLMLRNPINLIVGAAPNTTGTPVGGVVTRVIDNVIVDSADIMVDPNLDLPEPRGWSMWFQHLASGDINGNICAWNVTASATDRRSYYFDGDQTDGRVGINQTNFWNNISYDWGASLLFDFDSLAFGQHGPAPGLWLDSNDIQEPNVSVELIKGWRLPPPVPTGPTGLVSGNNRVRNATANPWCLWPEPTSISFGPWGTPGTWQTLVGDTNSTVGAVTYSMLIDGLSPPLPHPNTPDYPTPDNIEWFLGECRLQSKHNWRPEFLATNLVGRYGTFFN